ncbi:YetF domain-containing protein [Streptosporangium sp. NPDC002524]|uniref:YetF domain-containing protein n=1 Tax=Streptosporangium sp. NPDC002524 TaxID=3154537 RepID=UPI0033185CFF
MNGFADALIGDWHRAAYAAVKALALFLTAVVAFRLTERRTMAEFAPFDWVAAVAVGAIVGRTATASDASWLTGAAALLALLAAHAAITRLRFLPVVSRLVDPPMRILIRDGNVNWRDLRRCGLTEADLDAVLHQHGYHGPAGIHLAIFEAKGAVSILPRPPAVPVATTPPPGVDG